MANRTAFLHVAKASEKNGYSLKAMYDHNYRISEVQNADPERQELNREFFNDTARTYDSIVGERIAELQVKGAITRVRSNAVKSLEIIVRANGVYLDEAGKVPDDFDLEKWITESLDYLDHTFNPPNHEIHYTDYSGEEQTEKVQNLYAAMLHMDESTPHIHVYIMPVDERGHLNCKSYLGEWKSYNELQANYYEAVKDCGLSRGVYASPAKAEDIQKYHNYINKALSTAHPEHIEGETTEQYDSRVDEAMQVIACHIANLEREHEAELNREKAKLSLYIKSSYAEHAAVNDALGLGHGKDFDLEEIKNIGAAAHDHALLLKGIDSYDDKDYAADLSESVNNLIQSEYEKERTWSSHSGRAV